MVARGYSNFSAGFEKAFSIINNTNDPEFLQSDCLKMIIFLTDGTPNLGNRDADSLIDEISQQNTINAPIFSFIIGILLFCYSYSPFMHEKLNIIHKIAR